MKNIIILILLTLCGCAATQKAKKQTDMNNAEIYLHQNWIYDNEEQDIRGLFNPDSETENQTYGFVTEQAKEAKPPTRFMRVPPGRFSLDLQSDNNFVVTYTQYQLRPTDGWDEGIQKITGKWKVQNDVLTLHFQHQSTEKTKGLFLPLYFGESFTDKQTIDVIFKMQFRFEGDYLLLTPLEVSDQRPFSPVGKTYTALVRESCDYTTTGAYMDYTYCRLAFDADSVAVTEFSRSSEDDFKPEADRVYEETKYPWSMTGGRITIHGFDRYGTLEIRGGALIGKEEWGDGQSKEIEFRK